MLAIDIHIIDNRHSYGLNVREKRAPNAQKLRKLSCIAVCISAMNMNVTQHKPTYIYKHYRGCLHACAAIVRTDFHALTLMSDDRASHRFEQPTIEHSLEIRTQFSNYFLL